MFSLQQAVTASPVLAQMAQRVQRSQAMLKAIRPHVPAGLMAGLQAGPVDDDSWCLLVRNPAAANKLKLLTPTLMAALRQAGLGVARLRIKVQPVAR